METLSFAIKLVLFGVVIFGLYITVTALLPNYKWWRKLIGGKWYNEGYKHVPGSPNWWTQHPAAGGEIYSMEDYTI